MPCANRNPDREQEYLQNLGVIHSVLEELPSTCTYIVGEWNADLANNNHMFTEYMTMFFQFVFLNLKQSFVSMST